jgi:hypothetical protein
VHDAPTLLQRSLKGGTANPAACVAEDSNQGGVDTLSTLLNRIPLEPAGDGRFHVLVRSGVLR